MEKVSAKCDECLWNQNEGEKWCHDCGNKLFIDGTEHQEQVLSQKVESKAKTHKDKMCPDKSNCENENCQYSHSKGEQKEAITQQL